MPSLCRAGRAALLPPPRTVCLRIGLVLHRTGGSLPMMALPVSAGLGAVLGSGAQWTSWITRDDLLRMVVAAIDDERWRGPINAVAPEPARHADFQRALARTLRRPLLLRAPAFILRAFIGEMSSIFLFSQRVVPAKALALGFAFDVWWIADALALQLGPLPMALPEAAKLPSPAGRGIAPEQSIDTELNMTITLYGAGLSSSCARCAWFWPKRLDYKHDPVSSFQPPTFADISLKAHPVLRDDSEGPDAHFLILGDFRHLERKIQAARFHPAQPRLWPRVVVEEY
jgi:hypothetical protein